MLDPTQQPEEKPQPKVEYCQNCGKVAFEDERSVYGITSNIRWMYEVINKPCNDNSGCIPYS